MPIEDDPNYDPQGARDRVAIDMGQDWVKDTVYRSDTLASLEQDPDRITAFFKREHLPRRGLPIPVPKSSLTVRPAVDLRVLDRVAYQTLVDTFAFELLAELPDFVCGWRYADNPTRPSDLSDNSDEWRRYEQCLEDEWDTGFSYVLVTDVAGFFQNIPHALLRDRLNLGNTAVRNTLFDFLRIWNPSQIGLPQRVLGSSLLANIYLEPLDQVLGDYRSIRWMDDVAVFCESRREAVEAALRIQAALNKANLFVNAAKTHLLTRDEADTLVRFIRFRDIEYRLSQGDEAGLKGLADAWSRATSDLDSVDRTEFSFCVSRFIEREMDEPAAMVLGALDRLPHVSDHVSRYLRSFLDNPDVLSTVATFLRSKRNQFRWQEYRLATLFWHAETLSRQQLDLVRARAKSKNTYWAARNVYFRAVARHGTRADGAWMAELADQEEMSETIRGLIIAAAESRGVTKTQLRQMARDDGDLRGLVGYLFERDLAVPPLSF